MTTDKGFNIDILRYDKWLLLYKGKEGDRVDVGERGRTWLT